MSRSLTPPVGGNCFINAGRYILEIKDKKYKLIHGVIINHSDGNPMSHAWIEFDEYVLEVSQQTPFLIPKDEFYEMGKIERTISYTAAKAKNKIAQFGHWGHWELGKLR